MLRLTGSLLAMCLCANAQFYWMATPADGSRVYFATSLRQKNTVQPPYGKLFQVDAAGLGLLLSRDETVPPLPVGQLGVMTNAYSLDAASVSADGKVFAAEASRSCVGAGEYCTRQERFATTVTSGGQDKEYPGHLQVSANGAWVFGAGSNGIFRQAGYLFNLATGQEVALEIPRLDSLYGLQVSASGRAVADDGTVVYAIYNEVVTMQAGVMRRFAVKSSTPDAVLDRSGRRIVFDGDGLIRIADATGTGSSELTTDGYAPSLSDDGSTLLYLSARTGKPQVRIFSFDSSADRQLTSDTAGIAQAKLSGDGSTVYAVTQGARLLKISVATRSVQELIPRTPFLTGISDAAPGKLTSISGAGLTDLSFTTAPPLPESLNGIRVTIQGLAARLASVTPDALLVLVPTGVVVTDSATAPVEVTATSSSPFEGPHAEVRVAASAPELLYAGAPFQWVAAHQDWSGLISAESPARPGEVIHGYAVGLGDTSPAVAYGEAAPAREPFARITAPITCQDGSTINSFAEILFQGLAPNLAGVYQIDLRLPPLAADGNFLLSCTRGREFLSARIFVQSLPAAQSGEQR